MISASVVIIGLSVIVFLAIFSHCLTLAVQDEMKTRNIDDHNEVKLPMWVWAALGAFSAVCTGIIYLIGAISYVTITRLFAFF